MSKVPVKTTPKTVLFTFLLSALAAPLWAQGTYTAASCNQSDVNAVINGPTHTAVNGDTIIIPAGTCTWTSQLLGPSGVNFSLLGTGTPNSGSGTTGASSSCANGTTGTYIIDDYTSNYGMIKMRPSYNASYNAPASRISCMAIDPKSISTGLWDPILVVGTCTSSSCPAVRIDNITFGLNTPWSEGGNSSNAEAGILAEMVFGVIDHNTVGSPGNPANNFELLNSEQGAYLGAGGYGDNSWAQPDSLGGANNVFVENNLKYDKGYLAMNDSEQSDTFSNRGGDRTVMRYNTMYQGSGGNGGYGLFQDHGTDSGGRARGAREAEVYNNTIYCQAPSGTNCSTMVANFRSGTGLIFGNSITFVNGQGGGPLVTLNEIRNVTASWLPFAAGAGDGPWDQNAGTIYYSGTVGSQSNGALTMTDSSKSFPNLVPAGEPYSVYDVTQGWWSEIQSNTSTTITVWPSVGYGAIDFVAGDSYQVLRATLCIDQPGRGQGSYMSGDSTNCSVSGSSGPTYTGPTPCGYPSQALDPVYHWNDKQINSRASASISVPSTNRLIAYRDFYDAASGVQTSSSSPFSCNGSTGGTGWGTMANRPSSCSGACSANSPGCGYWATDANGGNGELYVWESSAWTAYYTPYTYPHPLTLGTGTGPTAPPSLGATAQ